MDVHVIGLVTTDLGWQIALAAALLAITFSAYQIICHLRHYNEPLYQRYILRIIFLVPTYASASWLSLKFSEHSTIFDTCRDCYEAWVIYNFMALCLAYAGGPGDVVVKADGYTIQPSVLWGTCCLPPLPVDGRLLRRCKQGTLQFVFLKPVLAICTLILHFTGHYETGDWNPKQGYLYITIIYNVCYTIALYFLLLFYLGTHEVLKPFKPGLKFILIKSIVFATFWQGVFIAIATSLQKFQSPRDGEKLQNFIICVEMMLSAMLMAVAFPYTQFSAGTASAGLKMSSVAHALSLYDVYADVIHQFSDTYEEYVLYSDGDQGTAKQKQMKVPGKQKEDVERGVVQVTGDLIDLGKTLPMHEVELNKVPKSKQPGDMLNLNYDSREQTLPQSYCAEDQENARNTAGTSTSASCPGLTLRGGGKGAKKKAKGKEGGGKVSLEGREQLLDGSHPASWVAVDLGK